MHGEKAPAVASRFAHLLVREYRRFEAFTAVPAPVAKS
jgi:hypothetical protein